MSSTTPAPKPRKFGGTPAQIRGAAKFYKVFAYITGVMLLLLVVEMIFKYFWSLELFVGGTLADGAAELHRPVQPRRSSRGERTSPWGS
ncbi:hypothetical protein AAHB37_12430 [Glutamicibacter halophytocola]